MIDTDEGAIFPPILSPRVNPPSREDGEKRFIADREEDVLLVDEANNIFSTFEIKPNRVIVCIKGDNNRKDNSKR